MAEALSHNRFAHWPALPARVLLAVFAALLVISAFTPMRSGEGLHSSVMDGNAIKTGEKERDEDLALYDRLIERLRSGENYYQAAATEHRISNYPLRPGFSVRLPTLAVIEAQLPPPAKAADGGMAEKGIAMLLIVAILLVWWRRFSQEGEPERLRIFAMAALFVGVQIGTIGYFFVLHELWAGALIALAMGLYRPEKGKWLGTWIAAAAALAIREHALPFVLLLGAFALWHRRWREAAAWAVLTALFLAAMVLHLQAVAALVRPDDAMGASWLTLRGLSGWMSMIVLSSNLRLVPSVIAGPLMMLMVMGWAGRRTPLAAFATLLYLGYGLAFMIAGRADNWYWGMVIAPTMFVGLAYAPAALSGLWRAAFPSRQAATTDAA